MATGNAVLKPPTSFLSTTCGANFHVHKPIVINLTFKLPHIIRHRIYLSTYKPNTTRSFNKLLVSFSANDQSHPEHDPIEGNTDSDDNGETNAEPISAVLDSLIVYKEALANDDEAKIAEVEFFLKSIENEKIVLEQKLEMLLEELSNRKAGILTISAEFNNFRKRTETERVSLVSDARGQVLESLLPVVDEFERATEEIKAEKEGEQRINNSYLSIYKQFVEILGSLRDDDPVETIDDEPSDSTVSTQAGSRFDRAIDEFRQKLNRVYSNFTKTWIRF